MDKNLQIILDYLHIKKGVNFSGYRVSLLERRLEQRLTATGMQDYECYLDYLISNYEELEKLLDAFTIKVSQFFRDPLTFDFIEYKILPSLIMKKINNKDKYIGIWSAGCATGEEPYSIAILINEFIKKHELDLKLNIFATDIDVRALKKAGEAIYSEDSISNVKYAFIKKYFNEKHNMFTLKQEIKDLITFTVYNILDSKSYVPPESVFGNFDIILCRNLLIYFYDNYQNIILNKLYKALSYNGYLILGDSEMPTSKYYNHFKLVNDCCHIYKKNPGFMELL